MCFGSASASLESFPAVPVDPAGWYLPSLTQGIGYAITQSIIEILVLVKSLRRVPASMKLLKDESRD